MSETKTNAMRMLENANISFRTQSYVVDENDLSGEHVADQLQQSHDQVFKTLVLKNEKREYFVCCIPVSQELDLKKAAKAFHQKKVEMIALKELLSTTGYIRGGCSPIGMKKQFPTCFDETAILFDEVAISAGIRGLQIIVNPQDLQSFLNFEFIDVVKE